MNLFHSYKPQESLLPEQHFQPFEEPFTERFAELAKRDGLSQRSVKRREALLSKNEDAMDTTSPE